MPDPKLSSTHSPTAAFKVTVGPISESTQQDSKGIVQITIETHLDMIGVAKVVFDATDFKPGDIEIGQDVKVEIGSGDTPAFVGYITSISHSLTKGNEQIIVTAMDPLIKLASSSVTKVWGGAPTDKFKDSDLASDVISAGGCTAGTVDATTGERPYVFQRAESNLAFLKRLASRNGYLVYAEDGKVHFKKAQFSDSPKEVSQGDIIRLDLSKSDMGIPSKVQVFGWDYMQKKGVKGELAAGSVETIGGGAAPSPKTWGGDMHIVDVFVNSDASAKAMAEGEMNRMARAMVRGSLTVNMNGELVPGVKVKLSDNWTKFNAEGLVVGARHVVEPGAASTTTVWLVGNTAPE